MADREQSLDSFWETAEAVERFAGRPPDHRLTRMIDRYAEPSRVRALDLGCAGGRNTVLLAEAGFDVYAVDSSSAMVAHTRSRLASLLGEAEAAARVRLGVMKDLSAFEAGSFDLVVALGVLHQAESRAEWESAVRELSRVLVVGGVLLHAAWCPETRPEGVPLTGVPGEKDIFLGPHSGRHFLLDAGAHDAEMVVRGFAAVAPSEVVRVETERGQRITINGVYRRVSS